MDARRYLARFPRLTPRTQPTPLRCSRTDLPRLCHAARFRAGAEIGVWKGAFSALFCARAPRMRWYAVDPWVSYPAWRDTKNSLPPDEAETFMASAYEQARQRLSGFHNCTVLRMFSTEAAARIPDGSLDLVYVDADHGYDAVLEDLTRWAPKVRRGGVVSGHDYRVFANKPFIQVIEAVRTYTATQGITDWVTLSADRTPSWAWVVP